eukprot:Sspe_Gene.43835::Locus_21434_Transcript_1_1_Confidence_1.000_Length_1952::g.43835::m.43835
MGACICVSPRDTGTDTARRFEQSFSGDVMATTNSGSSTTHSTRGGGGTLMMPEFPVVAPTLNLGRRNSCDRNKQSQSCTIDPSLLSPIITTAALEVLQQCTPEPKIHPKLFQLMHEVAQNVRKSINSATCTRSQIRQLCRNSAEALLTPYPAPSSERNSHRHVEAYEASSCGSRDHQEDRVIRIGSLLDLCHGTQHKSRSTIDYFAGVFDGHGGVHASEFARETLFWFLGNADLSSDDPEDALRHAFGTTHASFSTIAERDSIDAGSTALAVLVREDTFYVANLGDSRAVWCRRKGDDIVVQQLTEDHNVKNAKEVESVQARGGRIAQKRVDGVLCVTRALGNRQCQGSISQDPDIYSYPIDWEDEQFIVIGTDGLFETLSNDEICRAVATAKAQVDDNIARVRATFPRLAAQGDSDASELCLDLEQLTVFSECSSRRTRLKSDSETSATCPLPEELSAFDYSQIPEVLVQKALENTRVDHDNTSAVVIFLGNCHSLSHTEVTNLEQLLDRAKKKSPAMASTALASTVRPSCSSNFGQEADDADDDPDANEDDEMGFDPLASSMAFHR